MHRQTPCCIHKTHGMHAQTLACTETVVHRETASPKNPWHACKPLDIDNSFCTMASHWCRDNSFYTMASHWCRDNSFCTMASHRFHSQSLCAWSRDFTDTSRARLHLVYRLRLGSPVPRRLGRIPLCAHILRPLTFCILVSNLNLTKLWANLRQ